MSIFIGFGNWLNLSRTTVWEKSYSKAVWKRPESLNIFFSFIPKKNQKWPKWPPTKVLLVRFFYAFLATTFVNRFWTKIIIFFRKSICQRSLRVKNEISQQKKLTKNFDTKCIIAFDEISEKNEWPYIDFESGGFIWIKFGKLFWRIIQVGIT